MDFQIVKCSIYKEEERVEQVEEQAGQKHVVNVIFNLRYTINTVHNAKHKNSSINNVEIIFKLIEYE